MRSLSWLSTFFIQPTPHCDNHFAAVLLVAEQKAAKWEMPKLWLLAGIAPKYL